MRNLWYALVFVVLLALAGAGAAASNLTRPAVAIALPYAAAAIFVVGLSLRVVRWSLSPVPFRIPTVCGQQKSLPWIKAGGLESPSSTAGVIGRMALEVLAFRSLFRNTRVELNGRGPRLIYGESKVLWAAALAFHWSLLIIVVRHLRLLVEPVPLVAVALSSADAFFDVGTPVLYFTDIAISVALVYLLGRRIWSVQVRYISQLSDYLALVMLIGIAGTGIWMRYVARIDVVAVKQFAVGLATFSPLIPAGLGLLFYAHLTLVAALAVYFPFSKLVHLGGVFLSPTRNLANNNRMKRYVNAWNYTVPVHTYQEWEAEFHQKIAAAGLPLERP